MGLAAGAEEHTPSSVGRESVRGCGPGVGTEFVGKGDGDNGIIWLCSYRTCGLGGTPLATFQMVRREVCRVPPSTAAAIEYRRRCGE